MIQCKSPILEKSVTDFSKRKGDLLGIEADDDGSMDPLGKPFGNSALASI